VTAIRLKIVFASAAAAVRMVSISSAFDGGNIEVASQTAVAVKLRIKPDPYTELEKKQHMQWCATVPLRGVSCRACCDHEEGATVQAATSHDKTVAP